jgi:hypothetical protein
MSDKKIKVVYLQHIDEMHRNQSGVTQLYFYTEKNGEIFLGTDNNSIEPEDIQIYLSEEMISKLKNPVFISEDERLYIDYANLKVYSGISRKEELHLIGILKGLVE